MTRATLFVWHLATGALAAAGMVIGIRIANPPLVMAAAGMFTIVSTAVAWRIDQLTGPPPPSGHGPAGDALTSAASDAARLFAQTYAWGGVAMFACYELTELRWQHAWQYGAGMLLIALGLWVYGRALRSPGHILRTPRALHAVHRISKFHGLAALVGVLVLAASGKLMNGKMDWAANVIFIAGGLAIAASTVYTSRAHLRLTRKP